MSDHMSRRDSAPDPQQTAMLRDSAADLVARSADLKRLRVRRGTLPGYDLAHLQQMADLGWLGILVPEAAGGLGLGLAEMAAVFEELGKGLMADPLPAVALATRVLCHAHWQGATERLGAIAEGRGLPAVAWQEGLGGIASSQATTQALFQGDCWFLTGRKRFVAGAAGAAGYLVSAATPQGPAMSWVDAGAPGLTVTHEWRADQTPSGVLTLDSVKVPAHQMVSAPGAQGVAPLERALDETLVLLSSEMLGVMSAALQMALAYMRTRVQFGKPIGSFQALQHKAADLYVQQELTRAVLQDALREIESGGDPAAASALASRCKARASDACLRVTREVIQLHGAIGYTDEHDAGLYLKRALVLAAALGNAGAHRARFASLQGMTAAL